MKPRLSGANADRHRSPRARGSGGFTLLEVLLCLGLVIVLIGAMAGFLVEIIERRAVLSRGARDIESAGALLERIEADLLAGLAGGPGIGAGIEGTSTSLKLLTRGVDLPTGLSGAVDSGDLQGSQFEFDPSGPRLTARRISGVVTGNSPGAVPEVLSDRFERVLFRFYDGKTWRREFDTMKEGTLPVAVEVSIWVTVVGNAVAPVRAAAAPPPSERDAAAGSTDDDGADAAGEAEVGATKWGPPTRRRVIVVPDGPDAGWRVP